MGPELPQKFLDILYTSLDGKFHQEVYELFLRGEQQKAEYKEHYYGEAWKKLNHVTGGEA